LLFGPPQLVARDDVHVPFNPLLEQAILPSVEKIQEAIRVTLKY
jgi:2-oxoisovalerate dehydrogenase E1 component